MKTDKEFIETLKHRVFMDRETLSDVVPTVALLTEDAQRLVRIAERAVRYEEDIMNAIQESRRPHSFSIEGTMTGRIGVNAENTSNTPKKEDES